MRWSTSRTATTSRSSVNGREDFLYYIGKARDAHANAMAAEYIKRSTRFATCEMKEIRPLRFDPWAKHPSAFKVLLDPLGRAMDSAKLARILRSGKGPIAKLGVYHRRRGWIAGRVERWRADLLLALSPMTMPHELARVILAEQIYRVLTTLRGHPPSPLAELGPRPILRAFPSPALASLSLARRSAVIQPSL